MPALTGFVQIKHNHFCAAVSVTPTTREFAEAASNSDLATQIHHRSTSDANAFRHLLAE